MSAPLEEAPAETPATPPLEGQQEALEAPIETPGDIDGYQKLVEKLRAENKSLKGAQTPQDEKDRQTIATLKRQLKESDPAKVKSELAQAVAKAMGLESDEPPDPAALTAQITAEKATARQAQVELAVYRAAGPLGGDPAALLDSRSFMASLADVDPGDANAVATAIQTALEAAPALKTAPARRLPGPNPAPGGGIAPGIDDQIAAAKKAGDVKTWMHLENQKLAAPSR